MTWFHENRGRKWLTTRGAAGRTDAESRIRTLGCKQGLIARSIKANFAHEERGESEIPSVGFVVVARL